MEKFTWYCFNKNDELVYQRIIEQTPNLRVIEEETEKFIVINSKDQQEKKVKLEVIYVDLASEKAFKIFSSQLMLILKEAHFDAIENFSEKGPAEVVLGKSEESIIYSCLYKWSYDVENITALNCVAEFMYRYANEHVYENANKRTSLLFAIYTLSYLNLHVEFDPKKYDASDWRKKIIEIIQNKHQGESEQKAINELSEWIEKRIVIKYNKED